MGKSHTKILSEQVIPYRPILVNRLLGGNIHASILLTQMIYWADFNNPFYKFKKDEILNILERDCKFFESVLDEIKPEFLIIKVTDFHIILSLISHLNIL